jgi:hypothetical protein
MRLRSGCGLGDFGYNDLVADIAGKPGNDTAAGVFCSLLFVDEKR